MVRDQTGGDLSVEDAALYQALHRLHRQDLVDAEWAPSENNRRARFYTLTPPAGSGCAKKPRTGAATCAPSTRCCKGLNDASREPGTGSRDPEKPFWYLRRRSVKADVDEELSLHLEMRIDELVAARG